MGILQRSASILGLVLMTGLVLHMYFRQKSLDVFEKAHTQQAMLFGDSHADNIPWPGAPRFSGPAQDLFSALKMLEVFVEMRPSDSQIKTCVMTVWPHKFGPLAERRITGAVQGDQWGSMALGRLAPLMTWNDLIRRDVPWKYRLRLAYHTLQLKTVHAWLDNDCDEKSVDADFKYGQSEQVRFTQWFDQAHTTQLLFNSFVDMTSSQGWRLILIENPIHPCYYDVVNPDALKAYDKFIATAVERHGNAAFLQMGRENQDHTLFSDYHHLTCKGEALVEQRLRSLIGDQYPSKP